MLEDVRHSLRGLGRAPALALAVICTLAVAIGATAAVFSVVDKVLLRPLPMTDPDRVVVIWPRERANPTTIGEISYATFRAWQDEARDFQSLAAIGSANWTLRLREGEPATIPVAGVSASFFHVLGSSPAMGRTLLPEDDGQGSARVAVMSHEAWVRRFGSDPDIIGRRLRFEDAAYTIVGVMPDGFDYPRGVELWVPLVPQLVDAAERFKIDTLGDPEFGLLFVLGRLHPGVGIETARDNVSVLIARRAGKGFLPGMEAAVTPVDEHIFGRTRPALFALAACVGLVWLIACANAAVLLLVRATARSNEVATRLALGATRWRIVRQSLADSVVLSVLSGIAGLGLAYWLVKVLVALAPADVPQLDAVRIDVRTIAFAWIGSALTAILVGLAPGLEASHRGLERFLNTSGARLAQSHRVRRGFVVAQVSLALVLLVCAGLVGRSFVNLLRIDLGFQPDRVLTLDVTLPEVTFDRHLGFYDALLSSVRGMPDVEAAGAIYQRPLEHAGIGQDATILIEGQRTEIRFRDFERNPLVNLEPVTPGYFRAIGVKLVRGRDFTDADALQAPRVAIVSERLARRLWPGQDPLGKRLLPPGLPADEQGRPRWATVVGVAQDVRYRGLTDLRFDLYLSHLQIPDVRVKHLMVRTAGEPLALVGPIRAAARRLDAATLVENAAEMSDLVRRATVPWRFSTWTLGLLSAIAFALALLGVYTVTSQSVLERTREIGVRAALGARPRTIAADVLREGLALALIGIVAGLGIAVGAGRALSGLLFEVSMVDPLTLGAMAMLFVLVSAAALFLPASRAARLDPVEALRQP